MADRWNILDLPRPAPRAEAEGSWLVTLSDLLALLLTFFVMVFSMNAVQYAQWESVVNALTEHLNPRRAKVIDADMNTPDAAKSHAALGLNLDYLATVLDGQLRSDRLWKAVTVHRFSDRIVLSLPAETVFDGAGTALRAEAAQGLNRLASHLRRLRNRVVVAGHSDPAPNGIAQYPTNWELTLDRARLVASHLRRRGYRGKIAAIGYGSSRFADLAPELALQQRYDLARRIDIIIQEFEAGKEVRR